jgi:alcohol dehydrogenase
VKERLGARRVLVVTDPGLYECGLLERLLRGLMQAGLDLQVYLDISSDPLEAEILKGAATAKEFQADTIIGFGGGSPMDAAKAIAIMATAKEPIFDLFGLGKVAEERLSLLLIPTTAGTGSEATPYAVITMPSGEKTSITDRQSFPDIALLDAELTLGLPKKLTAACGIDAIVHAIEAFISKRNKTVLSDMAATRALKLLWEALPLVLENGEDLDARENMLIGAMLAGQAIATAPVGGVHTLAYPLGGLHHIHHGLSNSLLLPPVMRFNAKAAAPLYAEMADAVIPGLSGPDEEKTNTFIEAIEAMIAASGLETKLSDVGISPDHIPTLAKEAMKLERLLRNNPRKISSNDAVTIYKSIA